MFFRNLIMFRFPPATDLDEVETLLPLVQLKPVGPQEMSSRDFISPFGREEKEALSHRIGGWVWLTVGSEDRMLPAAVINNKLAEKIEKIEAREGRKLGSRDRKRLKDDLLHELLPQAFVKTGRTDVFLDSERGVASWIPAAAEPART